MILYAGPAYRGVLTPDPGDQSLDDGQPTEAAEREVTAAYDDLGDFARPKKFHIPEDK